ncbi:hypothetical protein LJK88_45050 [Paenibacillus sp. P26]|nr:hypothetical protein LJK88_45050 [Paenibacillus sp. P26]
MATGESGGLLRPAAERLPKDPGRIRRHLKQFGYAGERSRLCTITHYERDAPPSSRCFRRRALRWK